MSNKSTNNFLEEYIKKPIEIPTKEKAIERLTKLGVLDKDGNVADGWKDIIVNDKKKNEQKYYYRVVLFRKDNTGPMLEIAGFMDEKIADGYMRNLVRNAEGWDDDKLGVDKLLYALPPWTAPDDNLKSKIDFLINLETKEDCNEWSI